MNRVGVAAGLTGAILCIVAFALYVIAGFGTMNRHAVVSIALPPGREVRSDLITVDSKRLCSISVVADARSKYTFFSFPLRYSVVDASGQILSAGQTVFGDETRAVWTNRTMTGRPGGGYHHEFGYETFVVKPPGRIRVQAQLDPDTHTRPEPVEDINLIVYDNVRDHRPPVIAGCALFIAGVALGVFGIVKLIAAPRPRPVA